MSTDDKKYNGWTNYATWRVNLEIFDGMNAREFFSNYSDAYQLSKELKEYAENIIDDSSEGLAVDYALAFMSSVNWYEIAEHMVEDCEEGAT